MYYFNLNSTFPCRVGLIFSKTLKQQCANKNPRQKNRFTLNAYNIEAVNKEKAKSSYITKLGMSPSLTAFIISPYLTK